MDFTILSFSPNPEAGTTALVSFISEVAFLHIPSSVVYGSFILSIALSSKTVRLVTVSTVSNDEEHVGSFIVKIFLLLLVLAAEDITVDSAT